MIDTMMIGILSYIKDNNIRKQFIDVTLNSFRSVLSPLQAPVFYSYYTFASLYCGDGMSRDEYVEEIGKILPSLIDTFSFGFIFKLGELLRKCCVELLWENVVPSEVMIDIIEGLLKLNNEQAITLATIIPVCGDSKISKRFMNIVQTLRKQNNPTAIAYASIMINSRS
ncbi:hypothetical protein PV327_008916 [Microctonus hyperodae]|uniref:Uncharacterized protein n=1 Tax=Microctonus hyperodae TaxID=165561 RepID=A0AA39FSP8_MICHY|nr:hypothetical protein PV327_008916 [Microctonus hyperodae]